MRSIDGSGKNSGNSSKIIHFREPHFYSRVFYELPMPAFLIDHAADNIIIDVNKEAIKTLNIPASSLINFKISDVYTPLLDSYYPGCHLVFKKDDMSIIENAKIISKDNNKINLIEILSTSEFVINEKKYSILLFKSIIIQEKKNSENKNCILTDEISGLPNKLAIKYELEIFGFGGHKYTRIYVAAIFSIENLKQIKFCKNELFKIFGKKLHELACEEVFISRYSENSFLVIIHSRKDYMGLLEHIYKILKEPIFDNDKELNLSIKMGAYTWNVWDSVKSEDILLKVTDAHSNALVKKDSQWYFYNEVKKSNYTAGSHDRKIADIFRKEKFKIYFQPIIQFDKKYPPCALAIFKLNPYDSNEKESTNFISNDKSIYKCEENSLWEIDTVLDMIDNWCNSGIEINIHIEVEESYIYKSEFRIKLLSVCKNYPKKTLQLLNINLVNKNSNFNFEKLKSSIKNISNCDFNINLDNIKITEVEKTISQDLPVASVRVCSEKQNILFEDADKIKEIKKFVNLITDGNIKIYFKNINDTEHIALLKFLGFTGVDQEPCSKLLDKDDFLNQLKTNESLQHKNSTNLSVITDLIKPKLNNLKSLLADIIENSQKLGLLEETLNFLVRLKNLMSGQAKLSLKQIDIIESIATVAKDIYRRIQLNNSDTQSTAKNTAKIILLTSKTIHLLEKLIEN